MSVTNMSWLQKGFLGGKQPVLMAVLRLGVLLPLGLFAGSIVLLSGVNSFAPGLRPALMLVLLAAWLIAWLYASLSIFRCALNEEKNTWLAGMLLFLVPFLGWGVVSGVVNNLDGIIGLAAGL